MPSAPLRLRFAGHCSKCKLPLQAATMAWWDRQTRTITCESCQLHPEHNDRSAELLRASPPPVIDELTVRITRGTPGGSAQKEFEDRHQRREEKIDERWGRFAGVVKLLSNDPQDITAWAKGSAGERRLGLQLERDCPKTTVILHDRTIPGTRANIDHIAIAPSGIWVIDAKNYSGIVEHRDIGEWFRKDVRLYVGGRDRTKIVDGMSWQIKTVQKVIRTDIAEITGVLCFRAAQWRLWAKPFRHEEVWVTWATELVKMIAAKGPLGPEDIDRLATKISRELPAAQSGA